MLFFAVSSAGSCSPTCLPGFRHPGFRLPFRSSLLSGSLPSSRLSSRSSPFSPVLSGSLRFSPLLALSQVLSTLFPAFSSPLALPLSLFSSRLVLSFRPVRSSSRLVLFSFRPFFLQLPLSAPPAYSRSRSEPPALRSRSSSRSARLSRIESRIVQRLSNSWASMRGCSSLTTRMMSFIAT